MRLLNQCEVVKDKWPPSRSEVVRISVIPEWLVEDRVEIMVKAKKAKEEYLASKSVNK